METLEIRIDSLSYGGSGVGRHEGIVYFVPLSVPGDLLRIQITNKEKRYREAMIVEIIEASPNRVEPPCPYFGECGGCQWQQVDYKTQLEQKAGELRAALKKKGLNEPADRLNPIIPSREQYGYRRTARFKIRKAGDGSTELGFYRPASRELIGLDNCMLLDPRLNEYLPGITKDTPGLAGVDLFLDDKGCVHPYYLFSDKDQGADFYQVNTGVNEELLTYIRKTVHDTGIKNPRILDLYCGDGNLSLQFSDIAASINGWDNSKTAISRGRSAAESLKEEYPGCRIRFYEEDVARSWRNIAGRAKQTDIVILDPPRRGLKNQVARLDRAEDSRCNLHFMLTAGPCP